MPRGSEELANARKEEIVNACAALYDTMGFRDMTIRDIAAKTTFTRTSIYNYFQTKEEIFLALLQREHELWTADLEAIARSHETLSADGFADELSRTLEKRACMLKLMSMNLYDMEGNSRIEKPCGLQNRLCRCAGGRGRLPEEVLPRMSDLDRQEFIYALFPFMFGVYPYTTASEKQKEAMELAHLDYPAYSIYEIVRAFVSRLLRTFP